MSGVSGSKNTGLMAAAGAKEPSKVDQNLTGTWTDSSLVYARYRDASNVNKLSITVTNDAWTTYTKYESLADSNSLYGGPRSSKTHWFVKGYWGDYHAIRMSDGAKFSGNSSQPPYSMYAYEHFSNTVVSQNWSSSIGWNEHSEAITGTTSNWSVSTQSQTSGYIHGIHAMNGIVVAMKGHSSLGSYALISEDYGRNFSLAYTVPGEYAFGGYSIACPGWTGAASGTGAIFWHVGVDDDGTGPGTTKTNSVLYSEDGYNWTNLGAQSNGMGSPTYYGSTRIINIPGTNRLYWQNGTTLYKSTNGYQFSSVITSGPTLRNISFTSTGHLIGAQFSGTTVNIYKTNDTEDQITGSTTWSLVNQFTIADAASLNGNSLVAPYPN